MNKDLNTIMDIKKKWRVSYYMYNLTELVEEDYYTELYAIVRAYWVSMRNGWKVYVKEL